VDFSAFGGLFDPAGVVATLLVAFFAGMAGGAVASVLGAAVSGRR
jgi:hypothetical protein